MAQSAFSAYPRIRSLVVDHDSRHRDRDAENQVEDKLDAAVDLLWLRGGILRRGRAAHSILGAEARAGLPDLPHRLPLARGHHRPFLDDSTRTHLSPCTLRDTVVAPSDFSRVSCSRRPAALCMAASGWWARSQSFSCGVCRLTL